MITERPKFKLACAAVVAVLALSSTPAISAAPDSPVDGQATNTSQSPQVAATFKTGMMALQNGKLDAAEAAFKQILKMEPEFIGALLGLSDVALKRGRPDEARERLQQALAKAPEQADVQLAWGRFNYATGNYAEAESAFREALKLEPQGVAPRLDLGMVYMNVQNKPQDAVKLYEEAVGIEPEHGGAHNALGMAYAALGKWDQAEAQFRRAAELVPDMPLPWQALGKLYARQGKMEEALQAYGKALEIQPQFVPALLGRADVYTALKRRDEADREIQQALAIAPENAGVWLKLGLSRQLVGAWKEAEEAYLKAVSLEPRSATAYNNLAWMAAQRKTQLDKGLEWAKKANELAPGVVSFQETLGWVYRQRGDNRQALAILEKASRSPAATPSVFYRLGLVQVDLGDKSAARKAFDKALELNPRHPGALRAKQSLGE